MAISIGGSREEDVVGLIARKNYARAIQILRAQLQAPRPDPRVRLQLADVLAASGKAREAVPILLPLADEYAQDGFAAKAISVLKRIQRIDPGRRDIDARLAQLIERKQREATISDAPDQAFEIGIEEIGIDLGPSAGPAIAGARAEAAAAASLPRLDVGEAPDRQLITAPTLDSPLGPLHQHGEVEIGFEVGAAPMVKAKVTFGRSIEAHSHGVDIAREIGAEAPAPRGPGPASPLAGFEAALSGLPDVGTPPIGESLPLLDAVSVSEGIRSEGSLLEALDPLPLLPDAVMAEAEGSLDLEDYDLLGLDEIEGAEAQELPTIEALPVEVEPMSDDRFVDELMSLVDGAFGGGSSGGQTHGPSETKGGQRIVVSPLFKDFSVDEMVAVIAGLRLLAFERGDVIVREGEEGNSLYMLASGQVRAFRREPASGKQQKLADLQEGAFFGEVAILTRRPRTATVAALTRCELLELDRLTLDGIVGAHPRVREILEQFARERLANRPMPEPS